MRQKIYPSEVIEESNKDNFVLQKKKSYTFPILVKTFGGVKRNKNYLWLS